MEKTLLKRLKIGACSYTELHFKNQCLNSPFRDTKSVRQYFSQDLIDHLILNDSYGFVDDIFWQCILFDQCFIHICCEDFDLSKSILIDLFSSKEFCDELKRNSFLYISHYDQYIESLRKKEYFLYNIEKISSLLLKIIVSVFCFYNMNGILFLSHQHPKTWIEAFYFVSKNYNVSLLRYKITSQTLQCSFPFSLHITNYLKQHTLLQMDFITGLQHHHSCSKSLAAVINSKDKIAIKCLLKDFIFLSVEKNIAWADHLATKVLHNYVSDDQGLIESLLKLIVYKNILVKMGPDLSNDVETDIFYDVIFGSADQTDEKIKRLINQVSDANHDEKQKKKLIFVIELTCFHFTMHRDFYSSLIQVISPNNLYQKPKKIILFEYTHSSDLSVFDFLHTVGANCRNFCQSALLLLDDQPLESLQSFFSVLLVILSENPDKIETVADLINSKLVNLQHSRKVVRCLITACNELNLIQLGSLFLKCKLTEYNLNGLTDLLTIISMKSDQEYSIATLFKDIIRKRVIENYPVEILQGIVSNDPKVHCLFTNKHIELLCLKVITTKFGFSILNSIKDNTSWLCKDSFKQNTPDFFKLTGESYVKTRKAILETDPRHEFQSMELMLAYFYVKTSGKDNSNLAFITPAPGAKILDLKQLATLKNLGENKLFGCALPSWKENTCPLFLTSCFMDTCSGNIISKFLHHINQFPIRIDTIFLPAMRDDVFSKFRETLGEKFAAHSHHLYTWYECANGHIYAINNCGEPQQTGKCFCGGEIGGIKHNLSQGNRRLNSFEFKEKGYNLPPVSFHSSIDSERNVHGLSLAFLRWLLHAALVSSPKIKHCSGVFGLNTYDDIITYLQGRLENDFQGIKQSLNRNTDDTVIWMITSINHMFTHKSSIPDLDYSNRAHRDQLEDIYLDMIAPFISGADNLILRGQGVVYDSDDAVVQEIVGLTYPGDGPGLCEVEEYLHITKSITRKLVEHFQRFGSEREYPVVSKYVSYQGFIHLLYSFPAVLTSMLRILRMFKDKVTEASVRIVKLAAVIEKRELELWNAVWLQVQAMPKLIDKIHVPYEYMTMKLNENSTIADFLPSKTGPGVCSWYMINNLLAFHNMFASGHPIDIVALAVFVDPPCVPRQEIIAVTYDAFQDNSFDFGLLENSFSFLFSVKVRDKIDAQTSKQLLFTPLKSKDRWFIILKSLPKEQFCILEDNETITPAHLDSVEIAMQMCCSPGNVLTVEDICLINNLSVPVTRKELYGYWHQSWFRLSLNNGNVYIPHDTTADLNDFSCVVETAVLKELESLLNSFDMKHELLLLLHMLIVEWVIHYPGFDCRGMGLGEALDFFSEYSHFPGNLKCCIATLDDLAIEMSMQLWNYLC